MGNAQLQKQVEIPKIDPATFAFVNDLNQYEKANKTEIIIATAVNLGAMFLLRNKYSWTITQQKFRTPLIIGSAMGITGMIGIDYHLRKRKFHAKYPGHNRLTNRNLLKSLSTKE